MAFSELIALYLFLGGTAAGAFAVMAALDLHVAMVAPHRNSPIRAHSGRILSPAYIHHLSKLVYGASFALLVIGLLCLLADLGKPRVFYYLFLYPTASYMSIGAFALMLLAFCMAIALAFAVLDLGAMWKRVAHVAKACGIVFAIVVMLYTGMLLKTVISVAVWQSWWLPVLFALSALSCGCAVVVLAGTLSSGFTNAVTVVRRLAVADAAVIVLEACVTVAYAVSVNAAQAQNPFDALLLGDQAWLFWAGFIACGIAIPLFIDGMALARRREYATGAAAAVASLVLVGGLALRFALVCAGVSVTM